MPRLATPRAGDVRDAVRRCFEGDLGRDAVSAAVNSIEHALGCCTAKDAKDIMSAAGAGAVRFLKPEASPLQMAAGMRTLQLMAAAVLRVGADSSWLDTREGKRVSHALASVGGSISAPLLPLFAVTVRVWVRTEPTATVNSDALLQALMAHIAAAAGSPSPAVSDLAAGAADILTRRHARSRVEGAQPPTVTVVHDLAGAVAVVTGAGEASDSASGAFHAPPTAPHIAAAHAAALAVVLPHLIQTAVGATLLPLAPLVATLRAAHTAVADALAAVPTSGALTEGGAEAVTRLCSLAGVLQLVTAALTALLAAPPAVTPALMHAGELLAATVDGVRVSRALAGLAASAPGPALHTLASCVSLESAHLLAAVTRQLGPGAAPTLAKPLVAWTQESLGVAAGASVTTALPVLTYGAGGKGGRGTKRSREAAATGAGKGGDAGPSAQLGDDYIALDDLPTAPGTSTGSKPARAAAAVPIPAGLLLPAQRPGSGAMEHPLTAIASTLALCMSVWQESFALPVEHPLVATALRVAGAGDAHSRLTMHGLPTPFAAVGAWRAVQALANTVLAVAGISAAAPADLLAAAHATRAAALAAGARPAMPAPATAHEAAAAPVQDEEEDVVLDAAAIAFRPMAATAGVDAAELAAASAAGGATSAPAQTPDSDSEGEDEEVPDIV